MSTTLTPEQRDTIARTLKDWGLAPDEINASLTHGSFPPGVIGLRPDGNRPVGLGILIDTDVDRELADMFAWRARLSDQQVADAVEVAAIEIRVFVCPDAPEALLTFDVEITQPESIRRTFLLLMSKNPDVFRLLGQPGAVIWLLPAETGIRQWASEGAASPDDLYDHGIPIAQTEAGSPTILTALDRIKQSPVTQPESPVRPVDLPHGPDQTLDHDEEADDAEQEPQLRSWSEIQPTDIDPWFEAFLDRQRGLDSMLLQLCRQYTADEQTVMQAAGIMHEQDFVPVPDYCDGLYLARIGRVVAAIGGQLELHAVFPDTTYLLLTEPATGQPGAAINSDDEPLPTITQHAKEIGWRASPYHLSNDPYYAPVFQRLADLEETLWHITTLRGIDAIMLTAALEIPHTRDQTYIAIPEQTGVYIANLGLLIALMGAQLELRAMFPDQTHLLLLEPGPEHLNESLEQYQHPNRLHQNR